MAFFEAFLSFFLGKFFDFDHVYVHCVGVWFWCRLILGIRFLLGERGVVPSLRDHVSSLPLRLELGGSDIPVLYFGRDRVHSIDSFHEGGGNSPQKEVDQGVFMSDFANGNLVFKLRYIISKW